MKGMTYLLDFQPPGMRWSIQCRSVAVRRCPVSTRGTAKDGGRLVADTDSWSQSLDVWQLCITCWQCLRFDLSVWFFFIRVISNACGHAIICFLHCRLHHACVLFPVVQASATVRAREFFFKLKPLVHNVITRLNMFFA